MDLSKYQHSQKRILDILFSVLLLTLFSWLILLILLAYMLTLNFPVFFTQERVGLHNEPFVLYKFRTLKETNDGARLTFALGRILRTTSLDEFPQLVNVLKGEMSLVGPRPLPIEYLNLFSPDQLKRHEVRPGITGWTQVNGRHDIPWGKKFELDQYYVKNISLILDLKIMIRTIVLIATLKADTSLLEERFKGNE